MRSYTDGRGGFVLLEAVVALAIISLMAIAAMGAVSMQVRTADKAAVLLKAAALADERLATVRGLGYDDLVRMPDSIAAGTFLPPFEAYSWQAEVQPVEGEYDLFSVVVMVTAAGEVFALHSMVHEPRPEQVVGGEAVPARQEAVR
jgi:type II secretory pathway pseudopilin PulG